jgi:DNA-directed RNA polymerase sigma subunit (sigma70/sigma32)
MRFGIGMNTDHTLEEAGQQFSVTRVQLVTCLAVRRG